MASGFAKMPEWTDISIQTTQQRYLLAVPFVLTFCAGLTTVLRMYSRKIKKLNLGVDDLFCSLAMMLATATLVVQWLTVYNGAGLALQTVGMKHFLLWTKLNVVTTVVWMLSVSALQMSILAFYTRTFGVFRTFRRVCFGMMGVVVAWCIAASCSYLFSCKPVRKLWDPFTFGECNICVPLCASVFILHITLDISILIMPIHRTWRLQMSQSSKIVVTSLLLLGLFATICAAVRLECLFKILPGTPDNPDYWRAVLLQSSEVPIGIICACVPALRPVADKISKLRYGTALFSLFSTSSRTKASIPSAHEPGSVYNPPPYGGKERHSGSALSKTTSMSKVSSEDLA